MDADRYGGGEPRLDGLNCLVLGGGGFIGLNLCNALVARGAAVQAFGRSISWPDALDPQVSWTPAALGDVELLATALQGQDIVFHLASASVPTTSNRNPVADLEANVLGTVRLLELCCSFGIKKIIFASSGGTVYGVSQELPIPEDAATQPISAYGVGKLAIEKYLALYAYLHGFDYRILRIANAYGRYQTARRGQGVVASMLGRALSNEPIEVRGAGQTVRDFVHVDDVVSALILASLYTGSATIMNVGSGSGLSVNQIARDIEIVLGRGKLRRFERAAQDADVPANILDISLITRETGWRPRVPWLDGLRHTAQWMSAIHGKAA